MHRPHFPAHSPVVAPAFAAAMEAGMMLRPSCAAARNSASAARTARLVVAGLAPGLKPRDLVFLHCRIDDHDAAILAHQRRRFGLGILVHTDDDRLAALDRVHTVGIRLHQAALHVVDRGDRAAHRIEVGQFGARALLQFLDLGVDRRVAVEKVAVFQQVGLDRP
jgi:hypothetical protein